jgi:hypothetical protein
MRATLLVLFVLMVVVASGCLRSLHPLYTEKDLVYKRELLGSWVEEDTAGFWTFVRFGEKRYKLTHRQRGYQEGFIRSETVPGDSATFEVHLAQFGELLFMDLYPEPLERRNDLCKIHWIPVHTFSRVWIENDALKMSMLNAEWLEKMIDDDRLKIAHTRVEDELILTASTEVLQKLVISFANDSEAFPEPRVLFRVE